MFKQMLVIMLLLLGAALFAQQTMQSDTALPVDPELIIGKLPNGLTYYIKVNRRPEKRAELRLVANIGSVQEDDDQQGLAHFTEHMAFNGTKHFPKSELLDYLNSIGMGFAGGLNAATGLDQTTYMLKIPTDNAEQFRKGFLILSDWASGVSFDQVELDKERGVIIEEWRGGQGAETRLYDATRKVIFEGSKYAERMPIGKLEVLQNFDRDTIVRFYNDWYRPDLQAVVAVGDFDPAVVENLIKEYFGPIPAPVTPREVILYDVPNHAEPKVVIATDPEAAETGIQLNWKHPMRENRTVQDYRRTLVTNLFTQILNERLQELAQKPEPPFSYAYNFMFNMVRSKATYAMAAQVPEAGVMTGLSALLTEAERVNRFGFTQSELDRAKQNALRMAERMLAEKDRQDSGRLVWRYVSHFTYGNPVMGIEQNVMLNRALYDSITLEEVNQAIHELVTDENLVIAVTAPLKPGLSLPAEEDLLAQVRQAREMDLVAYEDVFSTDELMTQQLKPGKVTSEKTYKKIGARQWTLSNGVKVLLKKTDFKNDEIMLRAYSPGGVSLYETEDIFEAREAAGIITDSGVNGFDSTTLKKKLSGKIVNVSPFIDDDREGFTANCSPSDMETMFQLIYLYATAPRFDADSFTGWIARTHSWMQNEALSPESAFTDSMYAFFYNRHPRTARMKADDLNRLDMQRVMQIYLERFSDFSDFTFVIVGNFDEKTLKDYSARYLANLPAKGIREQVRDNGVRYAEGKQDLHVYKGQDAKSIVMFALPAITSIDLKTSVQLGNLTMLMNEKLRENIRETRSGVYFVGAWQDYNPLPVPNMVISVYMQCAPERVDELSDAVVATLDSLKAGLFEEKYINTIKTTRLKRLETDVRDNRWWMSNIYSALWNGYPLNDMLKEREAVKHLTLKELQHTAARFLNHDNNLLRAMLFPAQQPPE
jgi:zinc protease